MHGVDACPNGAKKQLINNLSDGRILQVASTSRANPVPHQLLDSTKSPKITFISNEGAAEAANENVE